MSNKKLKSVFTTLGASSHSDVEREKNDFYATDPLAIDHLKKVYDIPENVWECACGRGDLSKRLIEMGHKVYSSDLYDRGYGDVGKNFFTFTEMPEGCSCILTNPPYKYAMEFVLYSLYLLPPGGTCIMFLKTTFLEGQKRYDNLFSKFPPKYVFQFIKRMNCLNGGEEDKSNTSSAVSYCWFVFEKGFTEDTIIKWI